MLASLRRNFNRYPLHEVSEFYAIRIGLKRIEFVFKTIFCVPTSRFSLDGQLDVLLTQRH
jgi:hypothetical protein